MRPTGTEESTLLRPLGYTPAGQGWLRRLWVRRVTLAGDGWWEGIDVRLTPLEPVGDVPEGSWEVSASVSRWGSYPQSVLFSAQAPGLAEASRCPELLALEAAVALGAPWETLMGLGGSG